MKGYKKMDTNKKTMLEKRINKVGENLKKNNMQFYYAETKEDVAPIVKSLLSKGDTITNGGTVTMAECGLGELLSSPDYNYLDRSKMTPEEAAELYIKAFSADVYISSSNAITEDGVLYNVDGNSNRIAAIAFGPKSVIIIAGYNKIVRDLNEAEIRVKREAAPPNCERLGCPTYCKERGECVSLSKADRQISDGCGGDGRICCNYLISAHQRHKDRIKVIIVGEELGY
jgi:L-lactate utilization protein LutB